MHKSAFDAYRAILSAKIKELEADDTATTEARRPVELDQEAVGRLSRMDALQHQAMAQVQSKRRQTAILRAKTALKRMDDGEFGHCSDCGAPIEAARLDHDPTIPKCLDCARG